MTLNDIIESGAIIQCLGRVVRMLDADEDNPYGRERVLYNGEPLDCYSRMAFDWANRELTYLYPLNTGGKYPILVAEVC